MTKNNFIALTAVLKAEKPACDRRMSDTERAHSIVALHQWTCDVIAVMGACEKMNPRFRRDKFKAALGLTLEGK